jgi:hypothetical protein
MEQTVQMVQMAVTAEVQSPESAAMVETELN